MSYELSVSEVGAPEYPLLEVLRETIFTEAGHVSRESLAADLEGQQDVFALIAHLEGNPIGYKVGYRFGPGVYYSKSGGVLKDYRRNGLARRMQEWQHSWLRARGYRKVFFNSFNHFKPMIGFGLETGFLLTGLERQQAGDLSYRFSKDLVLPDPPHRPRLSAGNLVVQPATPETMGLIADLASLGGNSVHRNQIETEAVAAHGLAFLVYLDSRPIGYALGRSAGESTYLVTRFGIVDTYRDRGAEELLSGEFITQANRSGHRAIRWMPAHDDVESLRTALRAGFDLIGMQFIGRHSQTVAVLERSTGNNAA